MNLTDLDFNKPIYVKLKDGIHEVKFDRAELILVQGFVSQHVAVLEGKIAGVGKIDLQCDYRFTNDLDGLVHDAAETASVFGHFPSSGYHTVAGATHIKRGVSLELLKGAPFGYRLNGDTIERWLWEGTKAISVSYISIHVPGISDNSYGLRYDLLKRKFILPENCANERRCIAGRWIRPKWYNTKEECQEDNAIKVFTFEN